MTTAARRNITRQPTAASKPLPEVSIYTDGACSPNPGAGGYGVVLLFADKRRELSGGFRRTTNNRMEMLAAIVGLEALTTRCNVTVFSDSQYVVNAIDLGWAAKWRSQNWMRNKKEHAVNPDLWERLLRACAAHETKFQWVRGHAGNVENERCDRLAVAAASGKGLPEDTGYKDGS